MSHIKDLTGLRFTRLVVIERDMSPQRIIEILSVKPSASELKKKIFEIDSQLL